MKRITFKVATCNAKSLPQHWHLPGVFSSLSGLGLWGMQEMDPPRYKKRAHKKWPQMVGLGPTNNNTYSSPIGFSTAKWAMIHHWQPRLYVGDDGISYTRHATVAMVEHLSSEIEVGMVNLHGPVVKRDGKFEKRLLCRREAKRVATEQVSDLLNDGMPVVVTGDFNDKTNWFLPLKDKGFSVTRVGAGIDQVLFICDPDKYEWKVLSRHSVDTPSDHNTLRVQVQLTQR